MAAALEDLSVHGDSLACQHDHLVADSNRAHRHFGLDATAADARDARSQRLQRADRLGGLSPGAGLEPLAEQHQCDHHRRRLEIEVARRAGGMAGEHVVHAQPVGRAGADGNQHVHVAGTRPEGLPGPHVEATAQPELYRRREQELQPGWEVRVRTERHRDHRQDQRQREQGGDDDVPRLLRHAGSLGGRRRGRQLADGHGRVAGPLHRSHQGRRVSA